jgi:CDP-glycerol glycerophosphotransferase (TagB/SpsB family)
MSAIDAWIHRLDEIAENYNVMVTVHPWTSDHYKRQLTHNQNIHFISHPDILPYLMLADCVIGDTSSILAEACALDKSILTFKTGQAKRSLSEIEQLIKRISFQIDLKDDIEKSLDYAVRNPFELQSQRKTANEIMFDTLDGKAGERAAKIILEYLPELMI